MSATLFINKSDAFCGECSRPARADEAGHYTYPTWPSDPDKKGCGVTFTHVGSHYGDNGFGFHDDIKAMRPDLVWDDARWSRFEDREP